MGFQNPWFAENFEAFSYYCCPECNFKSKLRDNFETHALQNHENSKEFFKNCYKKSWAQSDIHEENKFVEDESEDISDNIQNEFEEFCEEEFVFENEELKETTHSTQGYKDV